MRANGLAHDFDTRQRSRGGERLADVPPPQVSRVYHE